MQPTRQTSRHKVLSPCWKDITEPFQNEFSGMTFEEVSLEALRGVPETMLSAPKAHFTQQDFDFLMSFKRGEPDWNLAPESHIQNLPAVQWKLRNIGRMTEEKRVQSLDKLEKVMTDWLS